MISKLKETVAELAEEAALQMVRVRGKPSHWHDLRDSFVDGADFGYRRAIKDVLELVRNQGQNYFCQMEGQDGDGFQKLDFAVGAMRYAESKIKELLK